MSFYGEYGRKFEERGWLTRHRYALQAFANAEFNGNLKEDQGVRGFTIEEAEELTKQYPEIWEQYKPKGEEVC